MTLITNTKDRGTRLMQELELEDIDQTYEGKNKEIMKDLERDGWAMTPFVDRADYFKEQGYDVENKGGVFMIKPKSDNSPGAKEDIKVEDVDTSAIDAIKDNFTPPCAKDEEAEIEKDEIEDFQKSLDDYVSKNKKGREDIPATYKR